MSTEIKDGGPAFPCDSETQFPTQAGMSLRDWFAGQALAAIPHLDIGGCGGGADLAPTGIAACAYDIADAMIAARERGAV